MSECVCRLLLIFSLVKPEKNQVAEQIFKKRNASHVFTSCTLLQKIEV